MACRQTFSLWYYLSSSYFWKYHAFNLYEWFSFAWLRFLRNEYFWHDTFGRYWNQFIGCKPTHKHPVILEDSCGRNGKSVHCFACEQDLES